MRKKKQVDSIKQKVIPLKQVREDLGEIEKILKEKPELQERADKFSKGELTELED